MEFEVPPTLFFQLPPEETLPANHLTILLHILDGHARAFSAAVALFDHSLAIGAQIRAALSSKIPQEERERLTSLHDHPRDWLFIAARDAAMTVYHFGITLKAIRGNLRFVPTLEPKVDAGELRNSWRRFTKSFAHWEILRNAVGHSAENISTRQRIDSIRPDTRAMHSGTLMDRTYIMDHKPRVDHAAVRMVLDITTESADELHAIKRDAFSAFRRASIDDAVGLR